MIYSSKRDWWLVAVTLLVIGVSLATGFVIIFSPPEDVPIYFLVPIPIFGLLILWAFLTTSYEIGADELIIRCGPLRSRIPLDAIVKVYPTHNPLSAPAWSLDRLGVHYRKNGKERLALISPEDKAGFLQELAQRVPGMLQ